MPDQVDRAFCMGDADLAVVIAWAKAKVSWRLAHAKRTQQSYNLMCTISLRPLLS